MTTRVWYENDAIQMDGVGSVPARSLRAVLDGDRVHILTLSDVRLSQLVYGEYARKDGIGFTSAADAKAYLDAEFGKALAAAWDAVTGKPSAFPPSAHTHPWGEVTGKPTTYPPAAHSHPWSDLTSVPTAFPPAAHSHAFTDITGKPSSYPPAAHTHLWADITDRPTIPAATPLSNVTPKPLGTAAAGASTNAAREDHVHPAQVVSLPNVTVGGTILLGAVSGPKKHTMACVGAKLGDRLTMTPVDTMPAGYMLGDIRCGVADQVEITVQLPAVVATYSIPVAITALRP